MITLTLKNNKIDMAQIDQLAYQLDEYLNQKDHYGYLDNDMDVDKVRDCLLTDPYSIIEFLVDEICEYANASENVSEYMTEINRALDLSKQVYEAI